MMPAARNASSSAICKSVPRDDLSLHLGPFNIQIKIDKFFAESFPPGAPTMRLFLPKDQIVGSRPSIRDCPPPRGFQHREATDVAENGKNFHGMPVICSWIASSRRNTDSHFNVGFARHQTVRPAAQGS